MKNGSFFGAICGLGPITSLTPRSWRFAVGPASPRTLGVTVKMGSPPESCEPLVLEVLSSEAWQRRDLMKFLIVASSMFVGATCLACTTTFNVTLETFGEGVTVELRAGAPGASKVVGTRASSGGQVQFQQLCSGTYFLAIGNGETVSVTPVRTFQNNATYSSRITVKRGSGNVTKRPKSSL